MSGTGFALENSTIDPKVIAAYYFYFRPFSMPPCSQAMMEIMEIDEVVGGGDPKAKASEVIPQYLAELEKRLCNQK